VCSGMPCGALWVARSQDFLLSFVDQVRYTYAHMSFNSHTVLYTPPWPREGGR
jgi:hypothetical protein